MRCCCSGIPRLCPTSRVSPTKMVKAYVNGVNEIYLMLLVMPYTDWLISMMLLRLSCYRYICPGSQPKQPADLAPLTTS